jgi:hypothetical protein
VRAIAQRREEDSDYVGLSNFRAYQDRETHEFVLLMPRVRERGKADITSPGYEYRFLPQ